MSSDTTSAVRGPVITAWSAVSPFGIGRSAFAEGMHEGGETAVPIDPEQWKVPDERARLVPGFSPREVLGRKGTRSMDRVTGLAVSAVGALLDDAERNRLVATGERGAIVLGTTTGSAQSMMDFTRDSLTGEQPYFVDPAQMPNTVMNCAAGQCAIWHRIQGPNATIAAWPTGRAARPELRPQAPGGGPGQGGAVRLGGGVLQRAGLAGVAHAGCRGAAGAAR